MVAQINLIVIWDFVTVTASANIAIFIKIKWLSCYTLQENIFFSVCLTSVSASVAKSVFLILIPKPLVDCFAFVFSANSTCSASGASSSPARRTTAALIWGLAWQHARAAAVGPQPARSSDYLQG